MTKSTNRKEQWQIELDKVPYKSVLSRYTNIKNRNKAFHKLDDETMRKEIAYDALILTLRGEISASQGYYWGTKLSAIIRDNRQKDAEEFQKCLLNLPQDCEVCARGAMMVSQIRLGNQLTADENYIDKGNDDIVKGFTMTNFYDMENCYELDKSSVFLGVLSESTQWLDSRQRKRLYRLVNICLNVLTNGNFDEDSAIDYIQKYNLSLGFFTSYRDEQARILQVWKRNPIK